MRARKITLEQAKQDLLLHTVAMSAHQYAALEMFMGYQMRGDVPEKIEAKCSSCRRPFEGVRWTNKGKIADTWGYIEFADRDLRCHHCLGEGYIGDIFAPSKQALPS